jgi:ankyrin repeat protein
MSNKGKQERARKQGIRMDGTSLPGVTFFVREKGVPVTPEEPSSPFPEQSPLGHGPMAATLRNPRSNLIDAASTGRADDVERLIRGGADANSETSIGRPVLICASEAGYAEVVRILLEHGATVDAKEPTTEFTALIYASKEGHTETVRALLAKGADINVEDVFGKSPLIHALFGDHLETAKVLLDHGADVNTSWANGRTLLTKAASEGQLDKVQFLVMSGADVNAIDVYKKTALDYAIERGHGEIERFLRESGAT